jgi:hypothetical protein
LGVSFARNAKKTVLYIAISLMAIVVLTGMLFIRRRRSFTRLSSGARYVKSGKQTRVLGAFGFWVGFGKKLYPTNQRNDVMYGEKEWRAHDHVSLFNLHTMKPFKNGE